MCMATGMAEIKIVVDTNILISAFVFPGGVIQELFERIITHDLQLGISLPILAEFASVLENKFSWDTEKISKISSFVERNARIVVPTKTLQVIADEPDNRILECAVEFKAGIIISGDKHILKLKKYGRIRIMKAADFIRLGSH